MTLKYEPSLDGVRALAAVSVLLFHAHVPAFHFGAQGVETFFVLSGFLITSLLAQEVRTAGSVNVGRFIARRARRLVPALLVVVAITTALTPLLLPEWAPLNLISALLAATYTMNIGHALGLPWTPLGHTWTLALEMQFYLAWPLLIGPLLRLKRPALVLLIGWALLTVGRTIAGTALQEFTGTQLVSIECLLLGAAVAFLPPAPQTFAWAGAAGLLAAMFAPLGAETVRFLPTVEIASAMLVAGLRAPSALRRALSWPPLVYLGLISYGVYLWHAPLTRIFNPYGWQVSATASLALAIALATISYATVERWGRTAGRLRALRQQTVTAT